MGRGVQGGGDVNTGIGVEVAVNVCAGRIVSVGDGLDDGKTVIDGHGLGAYLNHSCDPNCEVDEIKGRVWLFAIRDIAAGEELVWDYNLYDDEEPAPCSCGSPKCRGTMYSREWMAKMRRREARKKEQKSAAQRRSPARKTKTSPEAAA